MSIIDLLKDNIDDLKKEYLGYVFVGTLDSNEISIYTDLSTMFCLTDSTNINKDIKDIKNFLKSKNISTTSNWDFFSNFCNLTEDNDSGLIAKKLSYLDIPFLSLVDIINNTPRFYFKNIKEAISSTELFYNFIDEIQFFSSSNKTRARYLRRWLRRHKLLEVNINQEKIFLMITKGDNGTIVPKQVEDFFKYALN